MESAANGKSEVKAAIKQEPPSKPAVTIETSKRKLPSTITGEATETPSKRKLPSTITGETTELPIKGKPPSTISGTATETPKRKLPSSISGEGTETPSKRKLPSAVSGDAADETPPAKKKFNPYDYRNKLAAGPSAPGSKEIPEGAQNCLAGLSFVFTGELSSIGRDEATSLVKRYGGRVVGTPSSKTSYVVIGAEPGASKLKKVDDLNLKTVDEDGFLDLIRTLPAKAEFESPAKPKGKGKAATVTKAPARPAKADAAVAAANKNAHNGELWTTKYKPQKYDDVIGNKTLVLQLAKWLGKWEEYRANNFKRQGGDELSDRRAALLSGPPGIGKTTTAHLVAKLEGFDVLEFNASDTRSKKALDDVFRESIGSHAVTEYFGTAVASGAKGRSLADGGHGKRQLVIMDEVDGMSGGDRGGSAELIQLIKKSKVPIICICNDRASPKIKSLANHCADFRFRRPAANQVEARIRAIATVEGLELKPNVVAELVSSTSADIRQILNLLSTYRLSGTVMTFDQSKALAKTSEKNTAVSPFDATAKLFSPGSLNMSLNERIEMYFHDYGLMPLMVQESYVKSKPAIATHLHGNDSRRVALETLACMANAADSISLGDLVDRIQRGTQNWSLMPVHAVLSTVRPCFFTHGGLGGMVGFPSWLGKNSTQTKNGRQLKEVQSHMRLHISGSKSEVRLNYLPALASALTVPLATEGEDAIEDVIQFMDDYYLNKEDRDAVLELGIDKKMAKMAKDIPTSVKTAFTRIYNKSNHPTALLNMSFAKGKKGAGAAGDGVIPDSEDVVEAEEPVVEDDSGEKDDEDNLSDDAALGADKLIVKKAEKGKGTCRPSSASAASSSSSAAKGKAKASGSRKRS
ncbi:replication factor RFC1 C terminal domain-containing protein [Powellomyces hirtus]|nr:replication factor RFC1 C terminal domain-containing protein [Powellomyces hirtus]